MTDRVTRARKLRHLYRKGIMREITFEAYDASDPKQLSGQAWAGLMASLQEYVPGKDRKAARRLDSVMDALEAISIEQEQNKQKGMVLREQGGTVTLEDATFDLLVAAWDGYTEKLPGRFNRQRVYTDQLLEDAPQWNEKEWQEELARRSDEQEGAG